MTGLELLLSSARGVYIPQNFTECFDMEKWNVLEEDVAILQQDPYGEDSHILWETWHDVLGYAHYIDKNGHIWRLHQDGDLWAYCDELMTDEEYYNFFGEKRERTYTYTINLDERGEFSATVYDENGKGVLSIDASFFDDGYMKHKEDVSGLLDYLNDTLGLNVSGIEVD